MQSREAQLNSTEIKAIGGLGAIFSLRMFGIFMILPIFSIYAAQYSHSTETLIGFAIGIYGLTQAIFQIPFGILSDRFGRVPFIILGLVLFALGALIAGFSSSIYGVIFGRAVQGIGAVSSVIMALLSDLTREQNRTKVMAFIGMSFGVTMAISLVLGPILGEKLGLSGLFFLMALTGLLGIFLMLFFVPNAKSNYFNRETTIVKGNFSRVLTKPQLLKLDFSIFCLHLLLMVVFIALPHLLIRAGFAKENHWILYLLVMLFSFICLIPCVIFAERNRKMKQVLLFCIIAIGFAQVLIWWQNQNLFILIIAVQVFFLAFNVMEAILPSWISKDAPAGCRGTAMGIYSTGQFIGISVGATIAGWLSEYFSLEIVFLFGGILSFCWFLLNLSINQPKYVSSLRFLLKSLSENESNQIEQILINQPGIIDFYLANKENSLYLKIDKMQLNESQTIDLLKNFCKA